MSDRELGALGVDGLDVPGGEPRLGVGLECERHAPVLLGECVEGVRIGYNDAFPFNTNFWGIISNVKPSRPFHTTHML